MTSRRCFVIMPYGTKPDIDGTDIDFDAIYQHLIKPAVERVDDVECERCDDIDAPGWIHERMLRSIASAEVAVVDTSSLNANVFYELGVRHALRPAATVLIHRKGTTFPFNIGGLSSIEYGTDLASAAAATEKIAAFITNALADPEAIDSLVYHVLDDLRVSYGEVHAPSPIIKQGTVAYPLVSKPDKAIGIVTGDRQSLDVGDVWVSSENTNMQLDRFYGKSTSATIRYLGATKHPVTKAVVADTIADEVAALMGTEREVAPATVIATGSGALEATNGVRQIFHAAAVDGQPREGYRPIERIDRCVTNSLEKADSSEFAERRLTTMVFPVFGTGPGGADFDEQAEQLVGAAVDYLEVHDSTIETVYFYAWSDLDLDRLTTVLTKHVGVLDRPRTDPG